MFVPLVHRCFYLKRYVFNIVKRCLTVSYTHLCLPLFICFERKDSTAKELITLAVLVAVSAAGRFAFAWVPGFKPVTAITVIAAMYLGREAGFVVGALSAVVSNFYFGQGPWTPFQMFAWGFLGFLAGVLAQPLKRQKIWMCLYGVLAGVLFSLIMDVWSTLWACLLYTSRCV